MPDEIDLSPPPTIDTSTAEDVPPDDAEAAPPADADAEGTPPPVEEPEKKDEPVKEDEEVQTPKESAIARSLRARESKLVARQEQMAKERTEHEAGIRHFNTHIEQVGAQVKAFEAERASFQAAAKGDPVAFLEKLTGQKFDDFLRGWIKPAGEQALDARAAELKKEYDTKFAEIEKREREREEGGKRARLQQEEQGIHNEVTSLGLDATKHPTLAKLFEGQPAALIDEVKRLADSSAKAYYARTKQSIRYTPAQVLRQLESNKIAEYKRLGLIPQSPGSTVTESAVQTATKSTEKSGQKEQKAGTPAPNLTSKGASQRVAMPKPDLLTMSPEEQNRLVIAAIEQARKEQATARK